MKLAIELELADSTAAHLIAHLSGLRKPPRMDLDTKIITVEPQFAAGRELEEWAAQVLGMNIANTLRDNPTPTMVEQRKQVEAIEEQLRRDLVPLVNVSQK